MLAVTPGEPAGIGPELICRLVSESVTPLSVVAIADKSLLQQTIDALGLTIELVDFHPDKTHLPGVHQLLVEHVPLIQPAVPGVLNPQNAPYVLQTLDRAIDGCLAGQFSGMVTGPVQKSIINDAGIAFTGHTEYLCDRAKRGRVVMMLATEGLRVALVTTHLPLKDVASAITPAALGETIDILHHDLVNQFGIAEPRILVCGLNPHAGECGHMGREEIEVITPLLEAKRKLGINLVGPLPADTLFTPKHLANTDAVLAMYHDQGLPVLKYKGFGAAVNITLGLPFTRTSVDHGTALDLAGKGIADLGSLKTALAYAQEMTQNA